MSNAEEQYKNIREEIVKNLVPGDVLVFFYPNPAIEEIKEKSINLIARCIIGITKCGNKAIKKEIPFDDFIKYGTLLEKKKGT
ncbi:hypothetical protein LCGC14_2140660 [marine sediment metagenome]|uniref:Uncharacterized protein n=1 Tax=marine sediment metagenome TaxID=412755 RepID=A0A0F9GBM2_9ZZZZ